MEQNCEKNHTTKILKYVNTSNNENLTYADKGSSGFDLRAYITEKNGGTLRRNWKPKRVGKLERIVFNNVKYAPYVEYGHRTRGGKSFVDGVYMLEKSVKEIESELDKEFSIMIDNLFK